MQLSPREHFTIARGLEDHRDSTVYYVRATVRNALTDELLATVELTNRGDNHRYSAQYQVPADVSGQGFWLLFTTSVYTDSGYTTKASNYGDKFDTYLVMERANPNLHGGGGSDVDYKRIQKMIDAAFASAPKPIPPEPAKATDLSRVYDLLESVRVACASIRIPEMPQPREIDLSPVLRRIDEKAINPADLRISEADMGEIRALRETASEAVAEREEALEETLGKLEGILDKIRRFFSDDMERVLAGIDEVKALFSSVEYVIAKREAPREDDI